MKSKTFFDFMEKDKNGWISGLFTGLGLSVFSSAVTNFLEKGKFGFLISVLITLFFLILGCCYMKDIKKTNDSFLYNVIPWMLIFVAVILLLLVCFLTVYPPQL